MSGGSHTGEYYSRLASYTFSVWCFVDREGCTSYIHGTDCQRTSLPVCSKKLSPYTNFFNIVVVLLFLLSSSLLLLFWLVRWLVGWFA